MLTSASKPIVPPRHRIPSVRFPVKRCILPLCVVQPIAVTSTSSSPTPYPSPSLALGRCLVALEVRNEHPSATVTLHDIEAHVDGTARSEERASERSIAPGRGAGRFRRRGRGGGRREGAGRLVDGRGIGSSAPLEVSPVEVKDGGVQCGYQCGYLVKYRTAAELERDLGLTECSMNRGVDCSLPGTGGLQMFRQRRNCSGVLVICWHETIRDIAEAVPGKGFLTTNFF